MTPPKTDSDLALDLARLAQLFLSYGKHGAADKLLTAALELEPNNPAVTRVRAFTAYKCGRFAEAAALAQRARAADAANASTSSATSARLAAMGLSLVEAFSLMSLGRTEEAGQRYAKLDAPRADRPDVDPPSNNTTVTTPPAGRMNSE
jgi:tetratricopeptide (TPR) repeat protein